MSKWPFGALTTAHRPMSTARKSAPLFWTLAFLLLFNFWLDRITSYQEPPVVTDHRKIFAFLDRGAPGKIMVLGSSRVRSFQPLEAGLPAGTVTALPVSGGGMSTLELLWFRRLAPKFEAEGRRPEQVWLAVQASDFHPNDNFNRAAVVWGWSDFARGLADGIGDMERNFLQSRVYDWFTWSALVIDRNERVGFSRILQSLGLGGPSPSAGASDRAAARAQALDRLDPRELAAARGLIADMRRRGVAVTVLRMPLAPAVEALRDSAARAGFDARLAGLCDTLGASYRPLEGGALGLAAEDFGPDLIHLGRDGDEKFSRAVARLLIRIPEAAP